MGLQQQQQVDPNAPSFVRKTVEASKKFQAAQQEEETQELELKPGKSLEQRVADLRANGWEVRELNGKYMLVIPARITNLNSPEAWEKYRIALPDASEYTLGFDITNPTLTDVLMMLPVK